MRCSQCHEQSCSIMTDTLGISLGSVQFYCYKCNYTSTNLVEEKVTLPGAKTLIQEDEVNVLFNLAILLTGGGGGTEAKMLRSMLNLPSFRGSESSFHRIEKQFLSDSLIQVAKDSMDKAMAEEVRLTKEELKEDSNSTSCVNIGVTFDMG